MREQIIDKTIYRVFAGFLISTLLVFLGFTGEAQTNELNSLIQQSINEKDNTKKVDLYYRISLIYKHIHQLKEAQIYAEKGLNIADKKSLTGTQFKFLELLGEINYLNSNFSESTRYFKKLYETAVLKSDNHFIGIAYQGLSKNLWRTGNYNKSVFFGTEAVKMFENLGDMVNLAITKGNLGIVYIDLGELNRADSIYDEILIIYEAFVDSASIANVFEKKGVIKFYQAFYPYARKYYNQAYELYTALGMELEAAIQTGNIAETYEMEKKYHKAIEKYKEAIQIEKKYNYHSGLIFLYQALGRTYKKTGKYAQAKQSYFISLNYIKKIGEYRELPSIYKLLYELFEITLDYKNAYKYSKLAGEAKDSLIGFEVRNKINEIRIKYESERTEKQNEYLLKNEALKDEIIRFQNEKNKRQFIILITVIIFTVFSLLSAFLLFRLYKRNLRTGFILKKKNEHLKSLYKNITDSISYAGNIQKALLSSFKNITVNFSDSFVFYEPAHILSGDFYWSKKINDIIFIVVGDSTGHGIPGALVSILGMSYLNEIVIDDFIQTDTILNNLREKIKVALNQKGKIGEQKDGWDISICSINLKTGESYFSGAFNSLIIISNQLNENPQEKHLIELKADRQPVSVYHKEIPFSRIEFKVETGNTLYLFTDGFADQLNETEGKKFTSKRVKQLLLSVSREKLKDQKRLIKDTFYNWKGKFEQVDDVTVLGIKI